MTETYLYEDNESEREIFIQREFPKYAVLLLMSDVVYVQSDKHVLIFKLLFYLVNIMAGEREVYIDTCIKAGVLDVFERLLQSAVDDGFVSDVNIFFFFFKFRLENF